ncbi:MAG: hypothetical protein J7521_19050 [Caulobacter sp.]|nr:hypothetical protein [Caulobacter sp.]
MSLLSQVIHALYESPASTALRESEYAFPVIQTVHVLGVAAMAGTIALVDLNVLGVALRRQPPARTVADVLPITWAGFALAILSGAALFAAQSEKIYGNVFLQLKFVLLLIAGLNVIVFHTTTRRSIEGWSDTVVPPIGVKASAAASLLLWALVIAAGRYIAYY